MSGMLNQHERGRYFVLHLLAACWAYWVEAKTKLQHSQNVGDENSFARASGE
jgi:hypothetical protein